MIRSYLSRHQPQPVWDTPELERQAARVWRETGGKVVMLWIDKIANDWDRQAVVNIANQKYGRQKQ